MVAPDSALAMTTDTIFEDDDFAATLEAGAEEDDDGADDGDGADDLDKGIIRDRIARFILLQKIGAGGMGEVYSAYDDHLDRKVALKVLHRSRRNSDPAQLRLMREARTLAALSHPNVVAVFDAGIEDDEVYIAMEFVRGQTLGEWLESEARSWAQILEVFIEVAEGLAAVHQLGLVHRDVKPENVLIDQNGRPRLIDFGLARGHDAPAEAREPGSSSSFARDASLTRTGALMGTPQYMSPEQFEHHDTTAFSDQFSFCIALYEALYGTAPFAGNGVHARALAVLEGEIRKPPTLRDMPVELFAVIERGLRRTPEERWPDMSALLAALRGLLAAYDPEIEEPAARKFRRRMLIAIVGVVATTLMGFAGYVLAENLVVDARTVLGLDAALFVLLGVTAGASYRRWTANRMSRRIVSFILMLTMLYCVQDLVGFLIDRPLYHTSLSNALSFSILLFFVAPLTTKTLRWAGLWAGVCSLLMLVDPPRFYLYFQLANVGAGLLVAVLMPRRVVERWISNAASARGSTDGHSTHTLAYRGRTHF